MRNPKVVFALVAIPLLTYPGPNLSDKIRVAPALRSDSVPTVESRQGWVNLMV